MEANETADQFDELLSQLRIDEMNPVEVQEAGDGAVDTENLPHCSSCGGPIVGQVKWSKEEEQSDRFSDEFWFPGSHRFQHALASRAFGLCSVRNALHGRQESNGRYRKKEPREEDCLGLVGWCLTDGP